MRNFKSDFLKLNPLFINLNLIIFLFFIFWWYNVINGFVLHHYILDGEKIMGELFIYGIGSFAFPLLYTIYILVYLSIFKISEQSIYFKLIVITWIPVLLLFFYLCYSFYGIDNRMYFD